MKSFKRQKSTDAPAADINIDFGAASEQITRVFEPEIYNLRVTSASAKKSAAGNVSVMLDLIELDSGARVSMLPLWIAGPNADWRGAP